MISLIINLVLLCVAFFMGMCAGCYLVFKAIFTQPFALADMLKERKVSERLFKTNDKDLGERFKYVGDKLKYDL